MSCDICGKNKKIQIHHILPISLMDEPEQNYIFKVDKDTIKQFAKLNMNPTLFYVINVILPCTFFILKRFMLL